MKMSFSISVQLDDVGDIDNFNISSDIESEDNNLTDISLLNDFQVKNTKELISFIQGDDDDLDEDWSSPSLIFGMFTGEIKPKEDTSVTDETGEEQPKEEVTPNEPVIQITETNSITKD